MSYNPRSCVLSRLADRIAAFSPDQSLRLAIDGRTASGKTTVADELAEALCCSGREIIRTSIDGFHRPRAERYARGRYSAEGYYRDARDLQAVVRLLLDPFGPGGSCRYSMASFDLENDRAIEPELRQASRNAILVVDGTFLQRPELIAKWDLTLFVDVSEEIAAARGLSRDAPRLGGLEATRQLYDLRYRRAFSMYERLCAPVSIADVVLDNNDLAHPRVTVRKKGRLNL